MYRILAFFVVIAFVLSISACSEKKPPTQAAVKGNTVINTLQDMSHMYEKKNVAGFMNSVSENYKERQAFAASLQSVFSKYETVRFTIQYTKMIIMIDQSGAAKATFNWDSEWQTADGNTQKNGGRVIFVFDQKDGKLLSIDGKNPFIPQPAELPKQ